MKDIYKMAKDRVVESIDTQMGMNLKDNGKTIKN
jgi:hypothetical protein